ncbi:MULTISPECIES: GTP cyclohydrolase [Cupriavidus]|uniref:GTP cyclohydrolase n=1 Tax=Cupriavidus oxalaticus TaxID=96344 RepID=A0A4P7L6A2_9BURK|nr:MULTISPECIES: GTP cyclohydrolase [Cupriavidus]MBF6988328.1 GTP cyclohydrolase [Cupriavidus sp. IK-TO18]QBY50970.1 GTP cyclohydrolase [Cupriavidus oxalaticus]
MSQNNAIYKGFRVSARVRHVSGAVPGGDLVHLRFLATVTITQVSSGMGSRRRLPPMIQHFASAPHTAIALALSSARDAIDGLPTFVKAR